MKFIILRLAALLVPPAARRDWLAEWKAEFWYILRECGCRKAIAFCLGAVQDALWFRRNSPKECRQSPRLQSPKRCILLLATLAALSTFLAFCLPFPRYLLSSEAIFPHLIMLCTALLILPLATTFSLGDIRLRQWIFFGVKIALVLPVVFFGTLDLSRILSATMLQPHAALVGYVLALRWALNDQRQRCRVCLRLLSKPARIGQPSHMLLDWYGTEFMCTKGHGLLYVPGHRNSFSAQRWLSLDHSWQSLFS